MKLDTHSELIKATRQILEVLQDDPEARQQLAAHGFNPTHHQRGKQLLRTVEEQTNHRVQLEQERWALSQQINSSLKAVRDQLAEHARITRFALHQDPERLRSLRIKSITPRRWECVDQAIFFYQQFQRLELSLEAFGLSKKEVQQSLAAAIKLRQQRRQRTRQKGQAEHRTQEAQQARAQLRAWAVDFRTIARVAYRHQPQQLEMFGIRVRSTVI